MAVIIFQMFHCRHIWSIFPRWSEVSDSPCRCWARNWDPGQLFLSALPGRPSNQANFVSTLMAAERNYTHTSHFKLTLASVRRNTILISRETKPFGADETWSGPLSHSAPRAGSPPHPSLGLLRDMIQIPTPPHHMEVWFNKEPQKQLRIFQKNILIWAHQSRMWGEREFITQEMS